MHLSRPVQRVVDLLLSELRLLRGGVQQLVSAAHDAKEAQNQQQPQQAPILRAELQIPEAVERERSKQDKRHYRVQVWLAIVTTLAFVAAAVYAGVATLQWKEMIGTTDASFESAKASRRSAAVAGLSLGETKKAAEAAASAAKTADATLKETQKSFQIDQRPYLVVIPDLPVIFATPGFVPDQQLAANVTLINTGRTPAIRTFSDLHLKIFDARGLNPSDHEHIKKLLVSAFADMHKREKQFRMETAGYAIVIEFDLAPQGKFFISSHDDVVVPAKEFPYIQGTTGYKLSLYAVGLITYFDEFGNGYETNVCYFYFGDNPLIWHTCDAFNMIK